MWLVNHPKVKVRHDLNGWVVLIQKEKRFLFWTKKYWIHIISISGMKDTPWYYSSNEMAISEAVKYFEWDLLINTKDDL